MRAAAAAEGKRLRAFTVEAEVRFGHPGDVHAFTDGRPCRMVVDGHPAPAEN
ncbi:hypothetical protein [Actinophytocola sp.]|jgi:hypothetical protein|uniref:hypothetical protein n=1 Tax=Actinophytocola sp. TaxID=1872138 RepID=UPI002ED84BA3